MTKRRALEILRDYWGCGEIVGVKLCNEIQAVELPGETILRTVSRIAGVEDYINKVTPFNNTAIYWMASYLLARMGY